MQTQKPYISFYYKAGSVGPDRIDTIKKQLSELEQREKISGGAIREQREAFPDEASEQRLLDELRAFGARHHVGLRRAFGSNKHGFWWLPHEFILVCEGDQLREVFPCEVDQDRIEPEAYLTCLLTGSAWTALGQTRRGGPRKHLELVRRISQQPEIVEPKVRFVRTDVHVSRGFGETGYIDVVLCDKDGRYVLIEVKVKPDEIDKAIGQVLRHRDLFCSQNVLAPDVVRVGIACPYIPDHARTVCGRIGVELFELGPLGR